MKLNIALITLLLISIMNILSDTIVVDINGSGDYTQIQAGIDAAVEGDTVLVYPGTYYENLNFIGKNIVLGSLIILTGNIDYIYSTIVCAYSPGPIVKFVNEESQLAELIGFTLSDGYSYAGGGIFIQNSSPKISSCIVKDCDTYVNPTWGGGIYCHLSSTQIMNTIIMNNSSIYGGGIAFRNPYYNGENPKLINVLIINNAALLHGGGVFCEEACVNMINVTVSDNYVIIYDGGGLYCENDSYIDITNSIFWDNLPQEISLCLSSDNSITFRYTDVLGGDEGIETNNHCIVNWLDGNIDADPFFLGGNASDPLYYQLAEDSPCIDTGTLDLPPGIILPDEDLAGNPRIYGGSIDMGCYEYYVESGDNPVLPPANSIWMNNYPNPFNPSTNIQFSIPEPGDIEISIFNIQGQKIETVLNESLEKGDHEVLWYGKDQNDQEVSSGVYFYGLKVNGKTRAVKKMLLLK